MEEKSAWWETAAMTRINVFVEGQTEETFVREVLAPYFVNMEVYLYATIARTSPGHKGGIVSYGKIKWQLENLCNSDPSAYVTTMMDYYKFPEDFPGLSNIKDVDALQRVQKIEQALLADIGARNFIPNLMLHEFEALLFCAPEKFVDWIDEDVPVRQLIQIKHEFESPEHINNNPNTAPSKRILGLIPKYQKPLHGPLIADDIGLDEIRAQCAHFNQWISTLSALSQSRGE
jgi:hypothetical protein